jgi:hypothetical protein
VRAVTALQLLSLRQNVWSLENMWSLELSVRVSSGQGLKRRRADSAPGPCDQLRANSRRSALNRSANFGTIARPCGAPG